MNDNLEFHRTYRNIISITWMIIIFVSIILLILSLIFNRNDLWYWNISYLLGAMTNMFAFTLLKNNIANITADATSSISGSFSNYAVRLMIYAFVLFVSFNNNKLNEYIVASGFLSVRLAIYIYSFRKRKE